LWLTLNIVIVILQPHIFNLRKMRDSEGC